MFNQDYDSIRVNLSEAIQRGCYKTIFIRHSEDTCLVASNDFKKIVAKFLHETTHCSIDNWLLICKHWWGSLKKQLKFFERSYVTYQPHNLEKLK